MGSPNSTTRSVPQQQVPWPNPGTPPRSVSPIPTTKSLPQQQVPWPNPGGMLIFGPSGAGPNHSLVQPTSHVMRSPMAQNRQIVTRMPSAPAPGRSASDLFGRVIGAGNSVVGRPLGPQSPMLSNRDLK